MASRVAQAASSPLWRVIVSPRVTTLTDVRASSTASGSTPSSLATVSKNVFHSWIKTPTGEHVQFFKLFTNFSLSRICNFASIRVVFAGAGRDDIQVANMNHSGHDGVDGV